MKNDRLGGTATPLEQARYTYQSSLGAVTLCLVVKEGRLLLARKMKKIGAGLWNGVGGKVEIEEEPIHAMVREAQEELGITPTSYSAGAEIEFYFPSQPEWNMKCHVFLVTEWEGQPQATDEMATPTWFAYTDLPWSEMWASDYFWLPPVLEGCTVRAAFLLGVDNKPIEYDMSIADPRFSPS